MLEYIPILLRGMIWTVVVSGGAILIGLVLGLPIALMRRSNLAPVRLLARSFVEIIRGIPGIVLLFIVFYGIGADLVRLTPLTAAVMTLGIMSAVTMSEIYRSAFMSISRGQAEAAKAIGLSRMDTLRMVLLPQAIRVAIPSLATICIGVLKDSAVASTVGVQDITALAVIQTNRTMDGITIYAAAALLYIGLSAPLAIASRWLHASLSKRIVR